LTGALWLAALCLLPLCGFPLLSHPAFRRLSIPSRVVLSGAVGAVLLSAAMTGSVLLDLHWNESLVAGAAVLLAAGLRLLLGKERSQPRPVEPFDVWTLAAHAVSALAVVAAILAVRSDSATSPDLFFFWGAKAQQFAAARTVDVAFLQNFFHRYMHLYYPPLVTNVYAFATMAAGRFPWSAAILTFPLLLGALAAGLPGLLGAQLTRRSVAAWSALAVAAIAYAGMEADVAGNGEMPLLLFEVLAAALLVSAESARPSTQILAGLLLAGAVTAKVEGFPFAVAACALFLVRGPRPRAAATARLLLPMVICLGAWFLFGATRHLFAGYAAEGTLLDLYPARLAAVARLVAGALWSTGYALPWLVPAAALLLAGRPRGAAWIPLGAAAVLTGFFAFTYLHRAEDPSLWISWSAPRIFMPVAALLVLAGACSSAPGSPTSGRAAPSPR
jgi:hypothetical protein